MANEKVARRYAAAIFQLAQESASTEQVGADLAEISGAIDADEATKRFFVAPVVGAGEKMDVLSQTFGGGKAHEIALHALMLLVRKRREALLPEIVRQYAILETSARGAEPLTLTSAQALEKSELDAMVARLEQLYKTKFDVTQEVDPNLIGGVRITMGDRRIDDSISGRLEDLARTLFAKN